MADYKLLQEDHIHYCGSNLELNLCTGNGVEISFADKQNKTYLKGNVVQILIGQKVAFNVKCRLRE